MNAYRTIQETDDSIETLYEIQKSKFITHLRHVDTEEEARAFIEGRADLEGYLIYEEDGQMKTWASEGFNLI